MAEVIIGQDEDGVLGPDVAGLTLQGLKAGIRYGVTITCAECDARAGQRADLLAMMHSTGRGQQVLGELILTYRQFVERLAETCTHLGAAATAPETLVMPVLDSALQLTSV